MTWQDAVNGLYESLAGCVLMLSIWKTHKEKMIRGISFWHVFYFTSWGWWNLYYYLHIGQALSFYGGIVLVFFNTIWLGQIIVYSVRGWILLQESENRHGEMAS